MGARGVVWKRPGADILCKVKGDSTVQSLDDASDLTSLRARIVQQRVVSTS